MNAVKVREIDLPRTGVTQFLWRLSEPYDVTESGQVVQTVDHIVTSASSVMGRPETYVFPADAKGTIVHWSELPGSFRGGLDHARALRQFLEAVAA